MFQRINQHFQAHHVLVPQQYGFQKGSATDNVSYKLTNSIFKAWNKKMYVSCISCELVKAFDRVNHELLLLNLNYHGTITPWSRVPLEKLTSKLCS